MASLNRLLTIRYMLEESSRMDLERRVALLARIEGAQRREKLAIHRSREQVLAAVIDESDPVQERASRRVIESSNAEKAGARWKHLRVMAEATENRVIEARLAFLERRTERRQVESVLESQQELRRTDRERRNQRELDDWFSSQQVRQKRNLPHDKTQF